MNANPAWPPQEVLRSTADIEELHDLISSNRDKHINPNENELLARFLIVRCTGHIEIVSTECFLDFLVRRSNHPVGEYLRESYLSWQTPNRDNLGKTLKRASSGLSDEFQSFLKTDDGGIRIGERLTALTKARAAIAHGKNTTITVSTALDYYDFTLRFSDWFQNSFRPGGLADNIVDCKR